MVSDPNKLIRFWHELKRRKVVKVVIVYAGAAYVIIELVNNVSVPLQLPAWTATLVILLLAIGFPIVAILAWIFDITPEGVKKTKPTENNEAKTTASKPSIRKLRISDIIIAVLVIIVGIMAYPKIFRSGKLKDLRNPNGRISITVIPFNNLTGDTLYNTWPDGFQNLLISGLSESKELAIRQYQTFYFLIGNDKESNTASLTLSKAGKLSQKLNTKTFILGNLIKAGERLRITAQLVNTETEEVYKTFEVNGKTKDNILALADSLTGLIRNFLEIKKLVEKYDSPLIRNASNANSSEAVEDYIQGINAFYSGDILSAKEWCLKSIEIDSGFIKPYIILAYCYGILNQDTSGRYWCSKAYKKRDGLPVDEKLRLDLLRAYFLGTPNEEIRYCKQILETDDLNPAIWLHMGRAYSKLNLDKEAISAWEKDLDIFKKYGKVDHNWFIYYWLGRAYHRVNDHKKENEIYKLGLSIFPGHLKIIMGQGVCAISQGDTAKANDIIRWIRNFKDDVSESDRLTLLGEMYSEAGIIDKAQAYFSQSLSLDPENSEKIYDLAYILINNDIDVERGLVMVKNALIRDPDNWYLRDAWGWGLYKQGNYKEALKVLKDAWDLRPSSFLNEGYQHIMEVEQALSSQTKN